MVHAPRPRPTPDWLGGPTYVSMTGLERLRAFTDGTFPLPAAYQLVGMRPVRADPAEVEYVLDPSGWLAGRDGLVAVGALAYFLDAPLTNPVHTTVPGGTAIRTVRLAVDFHAPVDVDAGPFTANGVLGGVREGVGVGLASMVSSDGTPMASGSVRSVNLDRAEPPHPSDAPLPPALPTPIESPAPSIADRPGGVAYLESITAGEPRPPFWALLDCRVSEAERGRAVLALAADPWMGTHAGILYGGVTASFGVTAAEAAMWSGDDDGERTRVLSYTHDFTRMVHPGASVLAEARLVHRGRTMAVVEVELLDHEGRRVGLGRATGLVGTVPS